MAVIPADELRHAFWEDAQAIVSAALLMALGVVFLASAHLVPGGTSGIAFLLNYATGVPFGRLYFAVNVPFYYFALRKMGRAFTVKTFAAVGLLAVFSELAPRVVALERVQPAVAAVVGGLLAGIAMMILFRHGASFGGISVLAGFLQDRFGWRAGYVQMTFDVLVMVSALRWVPLPLILVGLLGAVAVNVTLAVNHRPGRYAGF